MIKQWKNNSLNVIYFYLPNSKNNEILTSDGVLLPYDEFKNMSSETYNNKKNTNGGYDYKLSLQSERLVKKAVTPQLDLINSSNNINKTINNQKKVQHEIETEPKEKELPVKTVKVTTQETFPLIKDTKSEILKPNPLPKKEVAKPKIKTKKKVVTPAVIKEKKPFNLFDFSYPILILIVVIICSCLSMYFTGTYMQRLQNIYIAYAVSVSILIYGIIGIQMARRAFKSKHILQGLLYGITSLSVLAFSMFSAVDVNYARYKENHKIIEESYNVEDGKKISYELLKEELSDNKNQINLLNEDIKVQQTQYILAWDNEKKQNIIIEGRITATAQQKITEDNIRIEELNKRNKEINKKLMEYAESGISVEKAESKTDKAKSLTDLIGAMLGISGNIVQLIILLIPSIFTDLINILGTSIWVDSFEKKEQKN